MKQLLVILLFALPLMSSAQYTEEKQKKNKNLVFIALDSIFPVRNSRIYYTNIVQTKDSASNAELFTRAYKSIVDMFKSANDVIQMQDKENGIIIAKGFYATGHNSYINKPKIWYTLKIEVKDNRYKYTLSDVIYFFNVRIDYVNKDYEEPLEDWVEPARPVRKNVKKQTEAWLTTIDTHFKAVISTLNIHMNIKEEEW